MEEQNVFSEAKELERLQTQTQLMYPCEMAVIRELLAGKSGLNVLDVGCNDGTKTVCWFKDPAVARVVGLEFNAPLVQQANERFGSEVFSFHHCDVEAEDFSERLEHILRHEGVERFDILYLSFVLSHLRSPEKLLRRLRPLLRPGGVAVLVDSDDSHAYVKPEGGALFRAYLGFLAEDPYGGDRGFGSLLPQVLRDCGYGHAALRCSGVRAGPGEQESKAHIFEAYSYYPEDLELLRAERPNEPRFRYIAHWLSEHYEDMRRCFLAEGSSVSMGITVVTCTADADNTGAERSAEQ